MQSMFSSASVFNGDVSKWDTSKVTYMRYMFSGASAFGQTLCWNTSAVIAFNDMFTNTNGAGFNTTAYPGCLA
jgi:surface protein